MTKVARRNDAGRFRLHPLGFFYLLKEKGGQLHRTHIWLRDENGCFKETNECHLHSFDIRSTIQIGCMKNELYSFKESPIGDEHEFAVSYQNEQSRLVPTGRRGILETLASFENDEGTNYFLAAGVIHKVSIIRRPCVTTLVTEERDIETMSYGSDLTEPPFERRMATESEQRIITEILLSASL
jgi:hypothetical protein